MSRLALLLFLCPTACSDFHLFGESSDDNDGGTSQPSEDCDCPDGFEALPDGSSCVQRVEQPATFLGEAAPACEIEPYFAYGKFGVRWPGDTREQSEYWGQDDGIANGRLNEVGVWACDSSGQAGSEPVDEWIGFSVCAELEAPGLYLVGHGADNRMRLSVDGELFVEDTDDETSNFDFWWIELVELDAGYHILELEGYNAGSIAAFGAEIVGPFPGDTPTDDASLATLDYDGNIAWSTADAIGETFHLGESSGWTCPDGSALDPCADEPICVSFEYTECEETISLPG